MYIVAEETRQTGNVEPKQPIEAFIERMVATYPPPTHLRGHPDTIRQALDAYARALERFAPTVLDRAWQKVVEENEFWIWPKLSDIVQACVHFGREDARLRGPANDAAVERAASLAWNYRKRFMAGSALAKRAEAEGWQDSLRGYVDEAAWVQAQLIAGVTRVGYSAVLFAHLPRGREYEVGVEAFWEKSRKQAETGHIRVHVPHAAILGWKGRASQGRVQER